MGGFAGHILITVGELPRLNRPLHRPAHNYYMYSVRRKQCAEDHRPGADSDQRI
jgi:hypothetical protein